MLETFEPKSFVEDSIAKIKQQISEEKALVAVSGGVDSTTCAVLTHKAIGNNLVCVILDDAFMREGEPEYVAEMLSKPPFNVPMKIVDVKERFLQAMKGLMDAEEKRKMFRETFYQVLGETAKKEGCNILVQGTIKADIMETVSGVKTQHNVLEQVGINPMRRFGFKVVEPLATLYKEQVRMVARYLGLSEEFSERQPFPGPGLSVRVVGEIRADKLETLKKASTIAERELAQYKPGQYFAVIIDNEEVSQQSKVVHIQEVVARLLNVPSRNVWLTIFKDKATGVEGGKRRYGEIVGVKVQTTNGRVHQTVLQNLVSLQTRIITENPSVARVFYAIRDVTEKRPFVIGVRSVQTKNFLTAGVSDIPWTTLQKIAEEIAERCPNVSTVYYDVTPKPPATIEME
ncbi:MAG: GMP synthase [Candidatus Bathyarchaeota archaeon]|nr:GMP synthase [Candidatus Bathyarchaeota archaeon]MDH5788333.1 GMP synthase [Candidatus Bathyarchaeota archaeon]